MGPAVALIVGALFIGAHEPLADPGVTPPAGLSVGLGVQRQQDEFGLLGRVASPLFLGDHLGVAVSGGIGWYPDLRALPMNADDQNFGAWSLYGHGRLSIEASTGIALASGRLYAAIGPSVMLLSERLSTTTMALGVHGALGIELFAGDAFVAQPFSFYFEIGAAAHAAAADVAQRSGPIESVDSQIDRPIGTGLLLSGGVRIYLWR